MQTKMLRLLAALLAFGLVAAACGSTDDETTETEQEGSDTTASPEEEETSEEPAEEEEDDEATEEETEEGSTRTGGSDGELKIGYILPQTGSLSSIIDALVKPLEMGEEEIAAAGGSITLVPADSGTDADVASTNIDLLLNDDVDAVIGAAGSGVSLSIIDKVSGSQVVQCSGSSTAASLTSYDDGGFFFRTAPSDVLQGPALADVITDDGASTVAIVFRNDEYGAGFNEVLSEALEANGVTVVASVGYDPTATSFDAEVAQVAEAGPDAVAIITFAEGAQLLQGMIEEGAGPADLPIYVADGFKDTVTAEDVDPDDPAVLDGIRGTAPSAAPPNGEATFLDRFGEFAPETPTIFSAHKYDCLMTIVLASEVAGTDDASVFVEEMINVTSGGTKCSTYEECSALVADGEDIDYDGASGPLEFTDAGEPSGGVYDVFTYDAEGVAQTDTQVEV